MDAYNALRVAADRGGVSLASIGRVMGRPDNYVSNNISRGSIPRCDTMARMADVCGYKLALVPPDELTEGALVIDPASDREGDPLPRGGRFK